MPSYFYHLAIELFTRSLPETETSSYVDDQLSSTLLSFDSACKALLPFQKPARHSSSRRSRGYSSDKSRWSLGSSSAGNSNTGTATNTAASTATTAATPLYTRSQNSPTDLETDQRLDEVSIECIDMVAIPGQQLASSKRRAGQSQQKKVQFQGNNNDNDDNPVTTGIGTDILGGLRTKGRYIPLDQKTTDSIWGIVHLYRDAQETPFLVGEGDEYPADLKGSSAAAARQAGDQSYNAHDDDDIGGNSGGDGGDEGCTTLCILAVPSYLSPSDFLGFVGETTMDDVSHFRMIRTARANRYMVLMKFRGAKKAKEWQRVWNGKVFNSMEVCSPFYLRYFLYVCHADFLARNVPCCLCEHG